MDSYYSAEELKTIGFARMGEDLHISRKASIYGAEKIHLGSHVRIDDFVYLSGGAGIYIGDYVHIAVGSCLYGKWGIRIGSFVNVSGRVSIYSTSDDYSGDYMCGPMVGDEYIHDIGREVVIEDDVIIGAGSVILPGAYLREGCAIGTLSMIKTDTEPFTIYAGCPAVKVKVRSKGQLQLKARLLEQEKQ